MICCPELAPVKHCGLTHVSEMDAYWEIGQPRRAGAEGHAAERVNGTAVASDCDRQMGLAVTEPDVGGLHGHRHAVQHDDLVAPVELVGFA
jgi:hypothetical protein